MTGKARSYRRALGRWTWVALVVMLLPTFGAAAPPGDASLPNASALKSPEAPPKDAFLSKDSARHAASDKIRIGRIFFSPAERRHRFEDRRSATEAPSTAHAPRAERLEINGAISSNTQGRAVWVNGAAIEDAGKFRTAWTDRTGSVWLRDDRLKSRPLRPGQAMDRASGAIGDLLPAGSVTRR